MSIYPLSRILHYQFPTHQWLEKVTAPVTLFHGTGDYVVRYSNSVKLKKQFNPIELITLEGGSHNDLFQYPLTTQKLDQLLSH